MNRPPEEAGWTWSGGDADSAWSWMTPSMEWHYEAWLGENGCVADGEKAVADAAKAVPDGEKAVADGEKAAAVPVARRFKRKASQLEPDKPAQKQKEKTTFASRSVPKGPRGYARFSAIKKAFLDHLSLYLVHPSKYEDRGLVCAFTVLYYLCALECLSRNTITLCTARIPSTRIARPASRSISRNSPKVSARMQTLQSRQRRSLGRTCRLCELVNDFPILGTCAKGIHETLWVLAVLGVVC